ncbi:MAG: hypothetical protein GWP59_05805, partial [Chlamydiales bacterium]|nr:hypothetical protein [Chlamydiales bacterium]
YLKEKSKDPGQINSEYLDSLKDLLDSFSIMKEKLNAFQLKLDDEILNQELASVANKLPKDDEPVKLEYSPVTAEDFHTTTGNAGWQLSPDAASIATADIGEISSPEDLISMFTDPSSKVMSCLAKYLQEGVEKDDYTKLFQLSDIILSQLPLPPQGFIAAVSGGIYDPSNWVGKERELAQVMHYTSNIMRYHYAATKHMMAMGQISRLSADSVANFAQGKLFATAMSSLQIGDIFEGQYLAQKYDMIEDSLLDLIQNGLNCGSHPKSHEKLLAIKDFANKNKKMANGTPKPKLFSPHPNTITSSSKPEFIKVLKAISESKRTFFSPTAYSPSMLYTTTSDSKPISLDLTASHLNDPLEISSWPETRWDLTAIGKKVADSGAKGHLGHFNKGELGGMLRAAGGDEDSPILHEAMMCSFPRLIWPAPMRQLLCMHTDLQTLCAGRDSFFTSLEEKGARLADENTRAAFIAENKAQLLTRVFTPPTYQLLATISSSTQASFSYNIQELEPSGNIDYKEGFLPLYAQNKLRPLLSQARAQGRIFGGDYVRDFSHTHATPKRFYNISSSIKEDYFKELFSLSSGIPKEQREMEEYAYVHAATSHFIASPLLEKDIEIQLIKILSNPSGGIRNFINLLNRNPEIAYQFPDIMVLFKDKLSNSSAIKEEFGDNWKSLYELVLNFSTGFIKGLEINHPDYRKSPGLVKSYQSLVKLNIFYKNMLSTSVFSPRAEGEELAEYQEKMQSFVDSQCEKFTSESFDLALTRNLEQTRQSASASILSALSDNASLKGKVETVTQSNPVDLEAIGSWGLSTLKSLISAIEAEELEGSAFIIAKLKDLVAVEESKDIKNQIRLAFYELKAIDILETYETKEVDRLLGEDELKVLLTYKNLSNLSPHLERLEEKAISQEIKLALAKHSEKIFASFNGLDSEKRVEILNYLYELEYGKLPEGSSWKVSSAMPYCYEYGKHSDYLAAAYFNVISAGFYEPGGKTLNLSERKELSRNPAITSYFKHNFLIKSCKARFFENSQTTYEFKEKGEEYRLVGQDPKLYLQKKMHLNGEDVWVEFVDKSKVVFKESCPAVLDSPRYQYFQKEDKTLVLFDSNTSCPIAVIAEGSTRRLDEEGNATPYLLSTLIGEEYKGKSFETLEELLVWKHENPADKGEDEALIRIYSPRYESTIKIYSDKQVMETEEGSYTLEDSKQKSLLEKYPYGLSAQKDGEDFFFIPSGILYFDPDDRYTDTGGPKILMDHYDGARKATRKLLDKNELSLSDINRIEYGLANSKGFMKFRKDPDNVGKLLPLKGFEAQGYGELFYLSLTQQNYEEAGFYLEKIQRYWKNYADLDNPVNMALIKCILENHSKDEGIHHTVLSLKFIAHLKSIASVPCTDETLEAMHTKLASSKQFKEFYDAESPLRQDLDHFFVDVLGSRAVKSDSGFIPFKRDLDVKLTPSGEVETDFFNLSLAMHQLKYRYSQLLSLSEKQNYFTEEEREVLAVARMLREEERDGSAPHSLDREKVRAPDSKSLHLNTSLLESLESHFLQEHPEEELDSYEKGAPGSQFQREFIDNYATLLKGATEEELALLKLTLVQRLGEKSDSIDREVNDFISCIYEIILANPPEESSSETTIPLDSLATEKQFLAKHYHFDKTPGELEVELKNLTNEAGDKIAFGICPSTNTKADQEKEGDAPALKAYTIVLAINGQVFQAEVSKDEIKKLKAGDLKSLIRSAIQKRYSNDWSSLGISDYSSWRFEQLGESSHFRIAGPGGSSKTFSLVGSKDSLSLPSAEQLRKKSTVSLDSEKTKAIGLSSNCSVHFYNNRVKLCQLEGKPKKVKLILTKEGSAESTVKTVTQAALMDGDLSLLDIFSVELASSTEAAKAAASRITLEGSNFDQNKLILPGTDEAEYTLEMTTCPNLNMLFNLFERAHLPSEEKRTLKGLDLDSKSSTRAYSSSRADKKASALASSVDRLHELHEQAEEMSPLSLEEAKHIHYLNASGKPEKGYFKLTQDDSTGDYTLALYSDEACTDELLSCLKTKELLQESISLDDHFSAEDFSFPHCKLQASFAPGENQILFQSNVIYEFEEDISALEAELKSHTLRSVKSGVLKGELPTFTPLKGLADSVIAGSASELINPEIDGLESERAGQKKHRFYERIADASQDYDELEREFIANKLQEADEDYLAGWEASLIAEKKADKRVEILEANITETTVD